jgi:hypothetical protein
VRAAVFLALCLAACSARTAPALPDCPPDVPAPPAGPAKLNPKQMQLLEVRVELWAEKERTRGDACSKAFGEAKAWISKELQK